MLTMIAVMAQRHRSVTYQFRFTWIIGLFFFKFVTAQQQDPTTLNGGSVLAMAGDGCVALAVDKRFGSGPQVRVARVFSQTWIPYISTSISMFAFYRWSL
jgi:hypothetical protein